jgi:hypothetical protein
MVRAFSDKGVPRATDGRKSEVLTMHTMHIRVTGRQIEIGKALPQ